jgi:hypothetical protein
LEDTFHLGPIAHSHRHDPVCDLLRSMMYGSPARSLRQWTTRSTSQTEINFKLYRQATNKIVGISDEAAAFLQGFF